ncbi:class I SAM-dependent methyltransferase [Streptacidiphilus rugosus]|uniref:class I SAM-dependent methyltransferase n=1 Tax=Streptacidiphilus rugosus TaxID=405783 RepID=UPI00069143A3|nr:class I SAM-dependent methyltransferase [Streptacidiphilus rugosus]
MGVRSTLFAVTYDRLMAKSEEQGLRELRRRLIAEAGGRVLEIGGGTGANLALYGRGVESLTVTEPEPAMVRRLERHVQERGSNATVLRAPAEDLPFEDDSFDVVVSTLVLCGVSDQQRALRQLGRVLRPGGRLLFLEHMRSEDPKQARHQDRMNWLNRLMVCCECNRPTLDSVREAGFVVDHVEREVFPGAPSFIGQAVVGSATLPAPTPSGPGAGTAVPETAAGG